MPRNPTTHDTRTAQETTDAPYRLELLLDITADEGLLWLEHYGEYNDDGEPIVREKHIGRANCENCHEFHECYRLTNDDAGVPVCRDCLASYDGVAEVREA